MVWVGGSRLRQRGVDGLVKSQLKNSFGLCVSFLSFTVVLTLWFLISFILGPCGVSLPLSFPASKYRSFRASLVSRVWVSWESRISLVGLFTVGVEVLSFRSLSVFLPMEVRWGGVVPFGFGGFDLLVELLAVGPLIIVSRGPIPYSVLIFPFKSLIFGLCV